MRINYIYRPHHPNYFSIENVFSAVQSGLPEDVEFTRSYLNRQFDPAILWRFRNCKDDVFHITGAVNYAALGLPGRKTIITIHDTGALQFALKGWKKIVYKYLNYILIKNKVAVFTAISQCTKNSLVSILKIPQEKIRVIHNPLLPIFCHRPREFNSEMPKILQIGRAAHKNLDTLLESIRGEKAELLLIRPFDNALAKKIKDLGISFEWRSKLDSNGVFKAYVESDLIYFASTFEGFGLPIIEAMKVGRPVITSNIPPMNEISGGYTWLVNPKNPADIRNAIREIRENKEERQKKIEGGMQWVRQFEAPAIAAKYAKLYHSIM